MKTIHIDVFDRESLESGLRELRDFRDEFQRKANLACETVAAMLADRISTNLSEIPYSDDVVDITTHTPMPTIPMYASYARGNTVVVEENGGEIAFIEFGAGVYHNQGRTNPLSDSVSFDTSPGSFGNGNGVKPFWFFEHNKLSFGTPAYMPIYNAIEAIKPEIPTILREIFV